MLTNDPKRLRLLGIDLHSRARRRIAVVFTYLAYFIVMVILDTRFEPNVNLWLKYLCMLVATLYFMRSGVFRSCGPVKRMDERANFYHDMVLLRGLDDWSRYLYGGNYDALPAEQQHDVLMRYKVGAYLLPEKNKHAGFDTEAPDERELVERNRAFVRALQIMTTLLFSLTGIMVDRAVHHGRTEDMPSLFMTLGLAAVTLPRAVILWNEADPYELFQADEPSALQAP